MKKLYIALSLFLASFAYSQVPQAFSYQTIAFNSAGAPIANGNVNLRISILDNSATGTVLYTETHTKTTNSKGLVNLNIGSGTPTTGNFGGINWGTNSKFVKVEMDPAGGNNYTNVGVNQLMSVPYAQVSKTVVTGPGQGITLVSPNGTNYTLNVNDSGTLSLPTSSGSTNSTIPTNIYMLGSYNSYNTTNAELLRLNSSEKIGYKYLAANSKIKFAAGQNSGAQIYGTNTGTDIIPNGNDYLINSNGFYQVRFSVTGISGGNVFYSVNFNNFTPSIYFNTGNPNVYFNYYDEATNQFSFLVFGVTNTYGNKFKISLPNNESLGDNLSDGNFDIGGDYISFPGTNSSSQNFSVVFKINFDGTGTYTVTKL
ncbi:MAG: hypothetical protein E2600_14155 [Chryseobacterium sp.]|nr:hypothetical protein [Chryseobacterium sp.]